VEEVFRRFNHELPISSAGYHRLLDGWGIVKTAGPDSKLNEALDFLAHFAQDNIAVEKLYKKMPPSFQTSAKTLYRILGYIRQGLTRRVGVALIITPYNEPKKILLARDVSTPRIELGKPYATLSFPMGYARKRDSRKVNITRILQQEVFSKKTIEKSFPANILREEPSPFMYLDIADVRVAVYHIQLPKGLSGLKNFSSYKLKDHSYHKLSDLLSNKVNITDFRVGVIDICSGYKQYLELLEKNLVANPLQKKASLNFTISQVRELIS
jgi:hypothetical protein